MEAFLLHLFSGRVGQLLPCQGSPPLSDLPVTRVLLLAKSKGPFLTCLSLFSVGYSTCHWCHVMEEESFKNKEIGEIMNKNFVCIKVDREERPDVDKVYMTFVQVREARAELGRL